MFLYLVLLYNFIFCNIHLYFLFIICYCCCISLPQTTLLFVLCWIRCNIIYCCFSFQFSHTNYLEKYLQKKYPPTLKLLYSTVFLSTRLCSHVRSTFLLNVNIDFLSFFFVVGFRKYILLLQLKCVEGFEHQSSLAGQVKWSIDVRILKLSLKK